MEQITISTLGRFFGIPISLRIKSSEWAVVCSATSGKSYPTCWFSHSHSVDGQETSQGFLPNFSYSDSLSLRAPQSKPSLGSPPVLYGLCQSHPVLKPTSTYEYGRSFSCGTFSLPIIAQWIQDDYIYLYQKPFIQFLPREGKCEISENYLVLRIYSDFLANTAGSCS